MVEFSPTAMLDPIVKGWATEAGMRTEELSTIVGSNIIGGLIGVPLDMFLTQLGSKIASIGIGGVGLLLGTYTFKGKGRMQTDSIATGMRVFTEFLDPSPDDVKAIQRQIGQLVDGIVEGRLDKIAYAFIRNPREFQGMLPQAPAPARPPGPPAPLKGERPSPPGTPKLDQPTYPPGPGIIHKL